MPEDSFPCDGGPPCDERLAPLEVLPDCPPSPPDEAPWPLLEARYGEIPSGIGGYALVDVVAFARGFLIKGGAPDRERASRILLGEFRDGKLGKISLEVPNEPVWEDSDPAGSASIESDRIEPELGEPELGEPELGEPELGGPDPD